MKSWLAAFAVSLLFAAAAAGAAPVPAASGTAPSANAPSANAPSANAPSGPLVLYTSQPDQIAAETKAAFEARYPAVRIRIFRSGTTQVMNKLAAEFLAGRPQPDVLLIADAMSMQLLKDEGRLLADHAVDLRAFSPALYDPGRTYFGTKLITTGIIYNTHAPFVPRSWADLLKPAAKNEVVLPNPLYSGAALITAGAFAEFAPLGPGFLQQLAGAGAVAVAGNGAVLSAVAGGQKMFGMVVDFMALNAEKDGSPVRFVFPTEGVTAVTEPVAMLRTAHNIPAARAFVAFLLSVNGQKLAASQGFLPARRGIAPPAHYPRTGEIHLLPMNIPDILAHRKELLSRFAREFGD
ncbi:MAG: extracellular solute-binding protein [Acetobacteraceae bacterium]